MDAEAAVGECFWATRNIELYTTTVSVLICVFFFSVEFMIDASVSFHGWQSWRSHDTVAASAQIGLRILNEMGTPETRQVLVKIYVFPKLASCHVLNFFTSIF